MGRAAHFKTHPLTAALSIGEALLEDGCLAGLHGVVVIGLFHFTQFDCHLNDLAGELERHLVGFGDRRALVRTFVRRERAALGALDPTRKPSCGSSCNSDRGGGNSSGPDEHLDDLAVHPVQSTDRAGPCVCRFSYCTLAAEPRYFTRTCPILPLNLNGASS
jgi:hypothetical protein